MATLLRSAERLGTRSALGRFARASSGSAPSEAEAAAAAAAAANSDSRRMVPPQPVPRDFEDETLREVQEKIDAKARLDNTPAVDDETGGPRGIEPTRFGDWERKGRASDF